MEKILSKNVKNERNFIDIDTMTKTDIVIMDKATTKAAPINEKRFHRSISDSIANNYTPQAKHLNTKKIFDLNKIGLTKLPKLEKFPKQPNVNKINQIRGQNSNAKTRRVSDSLYKSTHQNYLDNIFSHLISENGEEEEEEDKKRTQTHRSTTGSLSEASELNSTRPRLSGNKTELIFTDDFQPWFKSTHGLSRSNSPDLNCEERYYLTINEFIDERMLYDMPEESFVNILGRANVTRELEGKYPSIINEFRTDVRRLYAWSTKKAILDYVLKDEVEQNRLNIDLVRKEHVVASRLSFPWRKKFIDNKLFFQLRCFNFNPAMQKIVNSFTDKYSRFRTIDLSEIRSAMPLTLVEFGKLILEQLTQSREMLKREWLQECADILYYEREQIENLAANFSQVNKYGL